jgi:L-alanine-DL-glutamate epimerase-like enolase superfamily enzyme
MGGITGLMQCAALCHVHGVELVPHQTQPTIGHAANMHLMATVMHLAKLVEVADNPRRLNALFKNAPEAQNGAFPVPSGPGLGLELEKLEPRIKPL